MDASRAGTLIVQFDGSCRNNIGDKPAGPASYGFIVRWTDGPRLGQGFGEVRAREGEPLTNNVAEWAALEAGLRWLLTTNIDAASLDLVGDSQLVVNQVNGHWGFRKPHLASRGRICKKLLKKLVRSGRVVAWKARWIPRRQNAEADALSREAFQPANNQGKEIN